MLVIYISYKYCYVNCIETYFLACPRWRQQLRQLDDCRFHFFLFIKYLGEWVFNGIMIGCIRATLLFEIIWKKLMCHRLIKGCKTKFLHQVLIKFELYNLIIISSLLAVTATTYWATPKKSEEDEIEKRFRPCLDFFFITHNLKHPTPFGTITHLSSLNIFQLFVGPTH